MSRRLLFLLGVFAAVAVVGTALLRPSNPSVAGADADAPMQAPVAPDPGAAGDEATAKQIASAISSAAATDPLEKAEALEAEVLQVDRLRNGILAGDSSVLQDAKRYAVLGSQCSAYVSMLNHAAEDNDSYRFARSFLAERCAGLDLSIRVSSGEVVSLGDPLLRADDFVRQFDPDFSSAQSLASAEFPSPDELEPRSAALIDIVLKADYFPTLTEAMLAFAVDGDRAVHPRMRLPFVEDLPRMGNFYDYRSTRFLGLVALQVACLDRIVDCGPNSLFAIQLCVYKHTCRNGIMVEDYIFDEYSGRQVMASRIAAQRIVAARAARGRKKP
jgi:hypothetical protein